MHVFGLTGGIASGKSVVAARFRDSGVPVIDADRLAREVVAPGQPALKEIVQHFGSGVLREDGSLDRTALAQRVFGNPLELRKLNRITHPRVAACFESQAASLRDAGETLVCYEVPLLFENRLQEALRPVVLVTASREAQIQRAVERDNAKRDDIEARIASQMPLDEKRALADFVIDNDGPLADTLEAADFVLQQLRRQTASNP
jgi:dephospho-CoA kinase